MSPQTREEDINPNEMRICWKTMSTLIAKTKTIANVESSSQLT